MVDASWSWVAFPSEIEFDRQFVSCICHKQANFSLVYTARAHLHNNME